MSLYGFLATPFAILAVKPLWRYSYDYEFTPQLPLVNPDADHRPLLADREFQNILLLRQWSQADYQMSYVEFAEQISEMLQLIDSELLR